LSFRQPVVWILLLCALGLADRVQAQAQADSTATADADSLVSQPADSLATDELSAAIDAVVEGDGEPAEADAAGDGKGAFYNLVFDPEVGVKADVTKVNYEGKLSARVSTDGGGLISGNGTLGYDTYRRQNKNVEKRVANASYRSGELLPFILDLQANTNWSEDITINTGGNENLNKRKSRRAGVMLSKQQIPTGSLRHSVSAGWFYNDQQAINQGDRNDFDEGEINGAFRSGIPVAEGVSLATRLYGIKKDGQSALAGLDSPSSTTGDTLGAGVYYDRQLLKGMVVISQSNFDRQYLDYRRNSNGLIDTAGNTEAGISKVVDELEEKDAWDLRWDNTLDIGRVKLVTKLSHKFDKQAYTQSGVGTKENNKDNIEVKLSFPVGRDSLVTEYTYDWTWDDQIYQGASASRGRQFKKNREFALDWFRDIFTNTTLSARYHTALSQDIAQNQFNENDRDRLTNEGRIKLDSKLSSKLTVRLLAEYQSIDDIAIRATRSANNNTKDTYEVAPTYVWRLSDKVEVQQTFRMYIQYQDYHFNDREGVNKDDTYNKRGNLLTTFKYKPVERVNLTLKHTYNTKYNGTRTSTTAAGNSFYRRDQDQVLNRIDLAVAWEATDWLKLESATYRTKDTVERTATESITTRYSGELWLGGLVSKSWGPRTNPVTLDARIKRYLAYGPNVTDTSDDYWEADVSLKWSF
jgi:hypothetical protein